MNVLGRSSAAFFVCLLVACGPQEGTDIECGPGTVLSGSSCVPSDLPGWYDIRVSTQHVPADGFTKIPVLAIGQNADGSPATDAVIVTLSRPWAGTVSPAASTLPALGSTFYFTPCVATGSPA